MYLPDPDSSTIPPSVQLYVKVKVINIIIVLNTHDIEGHISLNIKEISFIFGSLESRHAEVGVRSVVDERFLLDPFVGPERGVRYEDAPPGIVHCSQGNVPAQGLVINGLEFFIFLSGDTTLGLRMVEQVRRTSFNLKVPVLGTFQKIRCL